MRVILFLKKFNLKKFFLDEIIKSEFPPVSISTEPFSKTILNALWKHSLKQPHRPAIVNFFKF